MVENKVINEIVADIHFTEGSSFDSSDDEADAADMTSFEKGSANNTRRPFGLKPQQEADPWAGLGMDLEKNQAVGHGSYGEVVKVTHTKSKKIYAAKRYTHMFEDLLDCKRLLREVKLLRSLDNPYTVKLHDVRAPGLGALGN